MAGRLRLWVAWGRGVSTTMCAYASGALLLPLCHESRVWGGGVSSTMCAYATDALCKSPVQVPGTPRTFAGSESKARSSEWNSVPVSQCMIIETNTAANRQWRITSACQAVRCDRSARGLVSDVAWIGRIANETLRNEQIVHPQIGSKNRGGQWGVMLHWGRTPMAARVTFERFAAFRKGSLSCHSPGNYTAFQNAKSQAFLQFLKIKYSALLQPGYRDSLLETAQEAVTIAPKCAHNWAQ